MVAYRRGREWEYRVASKLRDEGYFVIRAAGSKPIDLIAIKDGQVMLVECKSKKPSSSEVEELRKLGRELGVKVVLAVKGEPMRVIYEPHMPIPSETVADCVNTSPYEDETPFARADEEPPLLFRFRLKGEVAVVGFNYEDAQLEALRRVKSDNLELVDMRKLKRCDGYDKCAIYQAWLKSEKISKLLGRMPTPLCPYDYFGYCGYEQAYK